MFLGKAYEKVGNQRQDALIEYENAAALLTNKKEKIRFFMELAKVYQDLGFLKASQGQWKQVLNDLNIDTTYAKGHGESLSELNASRL